MCFTLQLFHLPTLSLPYVLPPQTHTHALSLLQASPLHPRPNLYRHSSPLPFIFFPPNSSQSNSFQLYCSPMLPQKMFLPHSSPPPAFPLLRARYARSLSLGPSLHKHRASFPPPQRQSFPMQNRSSYDHDGTMLCSVCPV